MRLYVNTVIFVRRKYHFPAFETLCTGRQNNPTPNTITLLQSREPSDLFSSR